MYFKISDLSTEIVMPSQSVLKNLRTRVTKRTRLHLLLIMALSPDEVLKEK